MKFWKIYDTSAPLVQVEQRRETIEDTEVEELPGPELSCETVERGRPSPKETNKKPRRRTRPPLDLATSSPNKAWGVFYYFSYIYVLL